MITDLDDLHSPPAPQTMSMHPPRKGPKVPLKLPASAFSPPNSGTGEKFPLAPSPSALRPKEIIDASVPVGVDLSLDSWKGKAAGELHDHVQGAVLFASDAAEARCVWWCFSLGIQLTPL